MKSRTPPKTRRSNRLPSVPARISPSAADRPSSRRAAGRDDHQAMAPAAARLMTANRVSARPQNNFRYDRSAIGPSRTLFDLPGTLDAVTGVGDRLEARPRDFLLALLAAAEGLLVQPLQGGGDLVQRLLLVLDQPERELLLEVVGA